MSLPVTASDLIDLLNQQYPERSPTGHETDREIWLAAGERRLVRRLLELRKQDEEVVYAYQQTDSTVPYGYED